MGDNHRARWDWLRELAGRHRAAFADGLERRRAHEALVVALGHIGWSFESLVEGIAEVLGIAPEELRHPSASTLAHTDAEVLASLIPALLAHDDTNVRALGMGLLALPATLYVVPADATVQWLEDSPELAQVLLERVRNEGLAWLGVEHLGRLARQGASDALRAACQNWCGRFEGAERP